jgi:hypothetical protein
MRKAVGLYPIVETAIPKGKISTGSTLTFANDTVTRVHTLADAPPPPVPDVVSRFQAKAALAGAGLLASVEAALADADPLAQLAWAEAIEFRRQSPTILGLAAALGLTETQVDDLFHAAAQIEA